MYIYIYIFPVKYVLMIGLTRAILGHYNAIITMIDVVASSVEALDPDRIEVRRAARRYRLFSTAVPNFVQK